MKSTHVKFVIDKKLDIENHLIGLRSYKQKLHSYYNQKKNSKNERYEKLLKLSGKKRKDFIRKELVDVYSPKNKKKLEEIKNDAQKYWDKIEKDFFSRIQKVFGKPFPYQTVRGVFSTANRFGYNTGKRWFATSIDRNKFFAIETAMHELTHFVFHYYFWKQCEKYGLSWKQIWNIKEAFTVLLNLEFADLRLRLDYGYPEHKEIRNFIAKEWKKDKNFEKVLDKTCKFVASNKNNR
jgi:hypothetical protein